MWKKGAKAQRDESEKKFMDNGSEKSRERREGAKEENVGKGIGFKMDHIGSRTR